MNTKILTFPLRISIIVLIFGALFKVMHWPYAKVLMLIGSVVIGLLYAIRFVNKKTKTKLDNVKLAIILIWVFNYLVTAFHLFYVSYVFEILLLMLFIYWFTVEGIFYFKNRKFKKNKFIKAIYYLLIALAICTLFFGIIFKIQHWPYGALLLTLGVLTLNILLVFDYFIIDRRNSTQY